MDKKETGGQAFPGEEERLGPNNSPGTGRRIPTTGMTLRDYFAIHCPLVESSVSVNDINKELKINITINDYDDSYNYRYWSSKRYKYADAMIKEKCCGTNKN